MGKTTGKIAVLAASFALFAGGVFALSMERGDLRTLTLWGCIAGLLIIALRQTVVRMRKDRK